MISGSNLCPILDFLDTPGQIISNLAYPKPFYIPAKLKQPLIAQLVPITELTVPAAVIHKTSVLIEGNQDITALSPI